MKFFIPVALFLTLIFGLPFQEHNIAQILPVRSLQVDYRDNKVRLCSDAGEGTGETFLQAVEDLKKNAPGEIFFPTTEHLILCDPSLLPPILESNLLPPAVQVYFAETLRPQEGLWEYLSAHPSPVTLATLRTKAQGSVHI